MSVRAANGSLSPKQAARLDRFLCETGLGFNPYPDRRSREQEFARLDALPDAALSAMGLRRAELAAHVYRDLLGGVMSEAN